MKSKQIQLNNKVGLYMRLSKDDERQGESLSIENQRNILTKYAQERGWTVIDEYVDDGYSGKNFDRPQVQRLLEDAKTGKIKIGAARLVRNALPNATFIGFTGTPISQKDRSTREVFGDYIDVYDMTQAVADGATRPVYYESRVINLKLDEATLRRIDDEYDILA